MMDTRETFFGLAHGICILLWVESQEGKQSMCEH